MGRGGKGVNITRFHQVLITIRLSVRLTNTPRGSPMRILYRSNSSVTHSTRVKTHRSPPHYSLIAQNSTLISTNVFHSPPRAHYMSQDIYEKSVIISSITNSFITSSPSCLGRLSWYLTGSSTIILTSAAQLKSERENLSIVTEKHDNQCGGVTKRKPT